MKTAIFLALLLFLLLFLGSTDGAGGMEDSARNRNYEGRRGLAALFEDLGYETEVWTGAPGALPRGRELLWLPHPPVSADREIAADGDLYDVMHYRHFLEAGGSMILPHRQSEKFLVDHLHIDAFAGISSWVTSGRFRAPDDEYVLHSDDRVIELTVGRGRLMVHTLDQWGLSNAGLRSADSARVAFDMVAELHQQGPILFDDSALTWVVPGTFDSIFGARLAPFTALLLIWLAVFTWRRAWVGPFPKDEVEETALSPLSRAQSRASLYMRGKRPELSGQQLLSGRLDLLCHRAHLRLGGTPEERLARLLPPEELPTWSRDLLRPITRFQHLSRLEADLSRLEAHLHPSESHD